MTSLRGTLSEDKSVVLRANNVLALSEKEEEWEKLEVGVEYTDKRDICHGLSPVSVSMNINYVKLSRDVKPLLTAQG